LLLTLQEQRIITAKSSTTQSTNKDFHRRHYIHSSDPKPYPYIAMEILYKK
jgi:hypothetical protein